MLYDLKWQFPKYNDNNGVDAYNIVSDFDFLYATKGWTSPSLASQASKTPDGSKYVPYSMLFDITPRTATNVEDGYINVIMLRKPAISQDHDRSTDYEDCYILNTRYFNTTSRSTITDITTSTMTIK